MPAAGIGKRDPTATDTSPRFRASFASAPRGRDMDLLQYARASAEQQREMEEALFQSLKTRLAELASNIKEISGQTKVGPHLRELLLNENLADRDELLKILAALDWHGRIDNQTIEKVIDDRRKRLVSWDAKLNTAIERDSLETTTPSTSDTASERASVWPRRRGPEPKKRKKIEEQMRAMNPTVLAHMKNVEMEEMFGASADTCNKARNNVLGVSRNSNVVKLRETSETPIIDK